MRKERSDFGTRLLLARQQAGISQTALAQKAGMSQSAYAQAEREGNGSAFTTQIADACGVNAGWLATGQGEMLSNVRSIEHDLDAHPDLSPIRTVKLKLQAGVSGYAIEPETDLDGPPIFFRNDWLRQRGYKPYNLIAVKVRGDSMEDKLYEGDMVVINTADVEPKDGEVFAVNYEGEPVIKRMKRERGAWWLASDNLDKRRFPDKECVDSSCIIVGQVIHKQSERI